VWVEPEDLHVSAAKVDVHAEELQLHHTAANARIEAAQAGVPAGAAVALGAAVVKWQADTTTLFGSLVKHSQALRGAAVAYVTTDDQNADGVEGVGEQAGSIDLGL
jgi:uncharacterized protein YukE